MTHSDWSDLMVYQLPVGPHLSDLLRVSGDQFKKKKDLIVIAGFAPLTKKSEDSGYEIGFERKQPFLGRSVA